MSDSNEVTLWPSAENYARFRAVCDDEVPDTFEDFEILATSRLSMIEAEHGITIRKISFNPDRMAQWCRANCGKVDAHSRSLYAAHIALSD